VEDTVLPRLRALGADMERVFVPEQEGRERGRSLRLPSGAGELEAILAATHPRLLVLDPVLAFLDPDVNPNNDPSVRRALDPLADLAEKYACAVLLVLATCRDERQQVELLERFRRDGLECKALLS
jgi:hypothetical protein